MKRKVKSKLILCIILAALALIGINRNEFNLKNVNDNYNYVISP